MDRYKTYHQSINAVERGRKWNCCMGYHFLSDCVSNANHHFLSLFLLSFFLLLRRKRTVLLLLNFWSISIAISSFDFIWKVYFWFTYHQEWVTKWKSWHLDKQLNWLTVTVLSFQLPSTSILIACSNFVYFTVSLKLELWVLSRGDWKKPEGRIYSLPLCILSNIDHTKAPTNVQMWFLPLRSESIRICRRGRRRGTRMMTIIIRDENFHIFFVSAMKSFSQRLSKSFLHHSERIQKKVAFFADLHSSLQFSIFLVLFEDRL